LKGFVILNNAKTAFGLMQQAVLSFDSFLFIVYLFVILAPEISTVPQIRFVSFSFRAAAH